MIKLVQTRPSIQVHVTATVDLARRLDVIIDRAHSLLDEIRGSEVDGYLILEGGREDLLHVTLNNALDH